MKLKHVILALFLSLFFAASLSAQAEVGELQLSSDTTETDSVEYELIVLELGFDNYLISQPPKEFYSVSYYKNWNYQYTIEWNARYRTGPNQELFLFEINYDKTIDYGLELEYKLYHFYRFFEKKYNITLVNRGNRP
jgi:hypothetical protein